MALQPVDLMDAVVDPWHDVKGEEEAKKLVDEIEARIDHDLKKAYDALPNNNVWTVKCSEADNALVLEEIRKRYHGWDIRRMPWKNPGDWGQGRLVFYPNQRLKEKGAVQG